MILKLKKLDNKAVIPNKAYDGDAGLDLTATAVEYDRNIDCYIYYTGISVEIPYGYVGLVFPRSSNRKTELYMTNHVGVIDSGYRGEILVCFKSRTSNKVVIFINKLVNNVNALAKRFIGIMDFTYNLRDKSNIYNIGDKIAQLIIMPIPEVTINEVDELSDSSRGAKGHGSSGN